MAGGARRDRHGPGVQPHSCRDLCEAVDEGLWCSCIAPAGSMPAPAPTRGCGRRHLPRYRSAAARDAVVSAPAVHAHAWPWRWRQPRQHPHIQLRWGPCIWLAPVCKAHQRRSATRNGLSCRVHGGGESGYPQQARVAARTGRGGRGWLKACLRIGHARMMIVWLRSRCTRTCNACRSSMCGSLMRPGKRNGAPRAWDAGGVVRSRACMHV